MTAIVEDLLLLARSDSGAVALEHVPVDLGDVAADGASAMGKPATDRGVHVVVDPEPAVVAGDPARLRQLVMILVDNAIRHSPTDGRVGVAVRAERPAARRWWSRTRAPGSGRRTCHTSSSASTGPRRARRRHRPRPGHRRLDRRPPRRPDRGREPGRGRRALRGQPARPRAASSADRSPGGPNCASDSRARRCEVVAVPPVSAPGQASHGTPVIDAMMRPMAKVRTTPHDRSRGAPRREDPRCAIGEG